MQGAGIFVAFFALIVIMAIVTADGEPLFTRTGSFREPVEEQAPQESVAERDEVIQSPSRPAPEPPPKRRLSRQEIEKKLANLYDDLDALEDEARELRLRSPRSSYADLVELRAGNARSTDPEREYVVLIADSGNDVPINISDWYIESYVTEEAAAIPEGARVMDRFRTRETDPIYLEPGERAYVVTGDPPFNVSFHENLCTGYIADIADVYPSLRRSCPAPEEELRESNIDLDNDACYEFVERLPRCADPEREAEAADISRSCLAFVRDHLNYDSCVENHSHEPLFDNVGYWRIYLSRERDLDEEEDDDEEATRDLWRKEREILRLIDENDRVVDVIEF